MHVAVRAALVLGTVPQPGSAWASAVVEPPAEVPSQDRFGTSDAGRDHHTEVTFPVPPRLGLKVGFVTAGPDWLCIAIEYQPRIFTAAHDWRLAASKLVVSLNDRPKIWKAKRHDKRDQ